MSPTGWSNAARRRAGKPLGDADALCWCCGVRSCTECGPDPDHSEEPRTYAVADDDYDEDEDL